MLHHIRYLYLQHLFRLLQEFIIPNNAATPPKFAPYPTDVGTAITGTLAIPAITEASAPSIPAIAIIQFAFSNLFLCDKIL